MFLLDASNRRTYGHDAQVVFNIHWRPALHAQNNLTAQVMWHLRSEGAIEGPAREDTLGIGAILTAPGAGILTVCGVCNQHGLQAHRGTGVDVLTLQAQHARHRRPADVYVQQAHLRARTTEHQPAVAVLLGSGMLTWAADVEGEPTCCTGSEPSPCMPHGPLHTCAPDAARAKASCAEKVDLPTPPLPDSTRILCRMCRMRSSMAAISASIRPHTPPVMKRKQSQQLQAIEGACPAISTVHRQTDGSPGSGPLGAVAHAS